MSVNVANATGEMRKVAGNAPGSKLSGSKPAQGISTAGSPYINLQYPLNVEGDIQQGHYIMFFINKVDPAKVAKWKEYDKELAEYNEFVQNADFDVQEDPPKKPSGGMSRLASAPKGALAVRRPGTVRLKQAISLYMPPSVKTTYPSTYSDTEIGA